MKILRIGKIYVISHKIKVYKAKLLSLCEIIVMKRQL